MSFLVKKDSKSEFADRIRIRKSGKKLVIPFSADFVIKMLEKFDSKEFTEELKMTLVLKLKFYGLDPHCLHEDHELVRNPETVNDFMTDFEDYFIHRDAKDYKHNFGTPFRVRVNDDEREFPANLSCKR